MKRLSSILFWKYSLNCIYKTRLHKMTVAVVCACAVAFTALSINYLRDYTDLQNEYLKSVSERELIVFNNVALDNLYSHENPPISDSEVDEICHLNHIETVVPMISFFSGPVGFTMLNIPNISAEEWDKERAKQAVNLVTWNNASDLDNEREFEVSLGDNYFTVSYPSAQEMDRKALKLDETISEGGYISEGFMKRLGLELSDLDNLSLSFECWINPLQKEDNVRVLEQLENGDNVEYEGTTYFPWVQKVQITSMIRGVVPDIEFPREGDIFLSADVMTKMIQETPLEEDSINQFINAVKEMNPDKVITDFYKWAPNAYYVTVDSIEHIHSVKEALQEIDPNFEVIQYYQDIQAGIDIISNNRNIMIYMSSGVLGIVVLLITLTYASMIDKRKYEFAMLRSNGFTKKEIRKVIYSEMSLQYGFILMMGIIEALLIFLAARNWLTIPFVLDGITLLWVMGISLLAIIFPTVLSLLFVNRYEPDRIMRGI